MTLNVLRAADRAVQPWKNGGGKTREVLAAPASGSAGDFDWRVSMAEVAVPGPFSSFPGIDRTLKVLEGRLELTFADPAAVHILTPQTAALDFPGDVAVTGRPVDGPVLDLNLMVRREAFVGHIRSLPAGALPAPEGSPVLRLLIALQPTTVRVADAVHGLARFDALRLDGPDAADGLTLDQPALLLLVLPRTA